MKILYVTTISNTVNGFLIPHIKFLIKQGNQVDVACNIVREVSPELIQLGCRVYNIEFQRSPIKTANYHAYRKIKKLVLEQRYDLVHVHTPVASFLTRLACRKIGSVKVLYTAHGFHFFKGAPLKNWIIYYTMEKLAARWTDGIITINEEDYLAASKMKYRKNESVYYIRGVGINLNRFLPKTEEIKSEFRRQYRYKKEDFILVYTAELNYNKHQDLLIKVVSLLKNKIPNLKLLLIGDGNLSDKYEKLVKKLDLENNIQFWGYSQEVWNLLKIADISVSSSRREGLPVNVMEAMATGLPLVVTDCRGNRDLVYNHENGYVVGVNDVENFASAVEKLYKSEELRRKFGEKSIQIIKMYSLEEVVKEIKEIYNLFF